MITINKIAKKYKNEITVSIFSALLVGLTGISFGKIVKSLLDNTNHLVFYIVLMLFSSFVFSFFSFFRSFYANLVAEKISQDITFLLYDKLIKAKSEAIQKFSISYINIVLIEDVAKIKHFLATQVSFFVRNLVMFIMGMTLMATTSIFLFFILVATAFIIIVLLIAFLSVIKKYNKSISEVNLSIINHISKGILMQKIVQIFNPNDATSLNLKNQAIVYSALGKYKNIWRSLMFATITFVCLSSATLSVYYGMNLVEEKLMTSGQFTSFLIYMLITISSLIGISNFRNEREGFAVSKTKIEEILALEEEKNGEMLPQNTDITINNLYYKDIFNNFSEIIQHGKSTAVVGKSGVGKSTLIDLLLGFVSCDKGNILINGIKIEDINIKYWHSIVSFCPQSTEIFDISISRNIFYGNEFSQDLYDKIILDLGLSNIKDIQSNQFSVGEKQRICIARALLKQTAKIFIFDEPTSALDIENTEIIFNIIKKYTEGKTVIIITHDDKNLILFDKIIKIS